MPAAAPVTDLPFATGFNHVGHFTPAITALPSSASRHQLPSTTFYSSTCPRLTLLREEREGNLQQWRELWLGIGEIQWLYRGSSPRSPAIHGPCLRSELWPPSCAEAIRPSSTMWDNRDMMSPAENGSCLEMTNREEGRHMSLLGQWERVSNPGHEQSAMRSFADGSQSLATISQLLA